MVELTKSNIGYTQYDQHQDDQQTGIGKCIAESPCIHFIENLRGHDLGFRGRYEDDCRYSRHGLGNAVGYGRDQG